MTRYIIDDKKSFDIFLRTERILGEGRFPIMSKFEKEESEFLLSCLNKYSSKNDKLVEMGCGGGRILKLLTQHGFHSVGFDNNQYFVNYCRGQGMDVFLFDATQNVPEKHRNKYKVLIITFNTLFNFSPEIRKRWVDTAFNFLTPKGYLIFSVYCDSRLSRSTIEERIKFYTEAIQPPKDYSIQFFEKGTNRGFQLIDPKGYRKWMSLWVKKEELIGEIYSWKNFEIIEISPMKCGIAFNVLLRRNK